MLRCPTCAFENDDFAITCQNCKGFLQNRVPNLNLFETAWGVLESPRSTFRSIRLAEHKNFSLLLFCCFGIALSFTAFWYLKLGRLFETLLDLIPWALAGGMALGLFASLLLTGLYHLLARLFGSRIPFRNSLGLLAYSFVPIVFSLVFVLPIELLTFGMYLFTGNPHPSVIKPLSYVLLVGFDTIMALWTVTLLIIGTSVVHRMGGRKALTLVLTAIAILSGAFLAATQTAENILRGVS